MLVSKSHPEISNVPNEEQIMNLMMVCQWLEKLREEYNRRYGGAGARGCENGEEPIIINSGFRSKMLNYAVGGVSDSNHLTGCAADIKCKDCTQAVRYAACLIDLFRAADKEWDEIILEKKGAKFWLHFAVRPKNNHCKVTCVTL